MPILRLDDDEARRLRELLDRVRWQAGVGAGGFTPQDVRTADAVQEALRRSSPAPGALLGPLVAAGGRARASGPSRWRRIRERARRAAGAGAAAGGADVRATP